VAEAFLGSPGVDQFLDSLFLSYPSWNFARSWERLQGITASSELSDVARSLALQQRIWCYVRELLHPSMMPNSNGGGFECVGAGKYQWTPHTTKASMCVDGYWHLQPFLVSGVPLQQLQDGEKSGLLINFFVVQDATWVSKSIFTFCILARYVRSSKYKLAVIQNSRHSSSDLKGEAPMLHPAL
jgi:hypothetical protein